MTDIEALAEVLAKSRRGVTARVNSNDRMQAEAALGWMQRVFGLPPLRGYIAMVQGLEGADQFEAAYTALFTEREQAEKELAEHMEEIDGRASRLRFFLGEVREVES